MIGRPLDYMSGSGEVRVSHGNCHADEVLVNVEVGPTREFEAGGKMNRPRVVDRQRASALRFADPRAQALLAAIASFRLLPGGFTNQSPATRNTGPSARLGVSVDQYDTGRMTYDLRRLRLHGLIERIPHTPATRSPKPACASLFVTTALPPGDTSSAVARRGRIGRLSRTTEPRHPSLRPRNTAALGRNTPRRMNLTHLSIWSRHKESRPTPTRRAPTPATPSPSARCPFRRAPSSSSPSAAT